MSESIEKWAPVVGHEGEYEVSNEGNVRNCQNGKVLTPHLVNKNSKHYAVGFYKKPVEEGGKSTLIKKLLSRVVLEAFVGPAPDGTFYAKFKNGDATNFAVSNLEWAPRALMMRETIANAKARGVKVGRRPGTKNKTTSVEADETVVAASIVVASTLLGAGQSAPPSQTLEEGLEGLDEVIREAA